MAELKSSLFGPVIGKVGRYVGRTLNGKNIVSLRPLVYKKSKSVKAKSVRGRFAVTVKFAQHINNIPGLSGIWRKAVINGGSSYHRLIKYNSAYTGEKYPTLLNKISPEGILLVPQSLSLNKTSVDLSFAPPLFESLNGEFESVSIVVLLSLYEPVRKQSSCFVLDNASLNNINIKSITDGNVSVPLSDKVTRLFKKYRKAIAYSSLLFEPAAKGKISWSSTFCKSFDLPPD